MAIQRLFLLSMALAPSILCVAMIWMIMILI